LASFKRRSISERGFPFLCVEPNRTERKEKTKKRKRRVRTHVNQIHAVDIERVYGTLAWFGLLLNIRAPSKQVKNPLTSMNRAFPQKVYGVRSTPQDVNQGSGTWNER
jgi:hypothetical protein